MNKNIRTKKLLTKAERAKRIAEGKARAAAKRAAVAVPEPDALAPAFEPPLTPVGRRKSDQGIELHVYADGLGIGTIRLLPGYRIVKDVTP